MVVMPIMSSVMTSTKRRPYRSPRCPNKIPPRGRERYPTQKVANASRVPDNGSKFGKKSLLKTSAVERVVDGEVVVLESGARDARHGEARHAGRFEFAHAFPYPPPPGVSITMMSSRATFASNDRIEMLGFPGCALYPVAPHRRRFSAGDTEGRHSPVICQHHRRHRLQESHAPLDAIATTIFARAARAAPDLERFEPHREAPLQHFRIREPRVGHVSLHGVGAVEVGSGARATADGFVVLMLVIAEREVVHRALARREHAERTVETVRDHL